MIKFNKRYMKTDLPKRLAADFEFSKLPIEDPQQKNCL